MSLSSSSHLISSLSLSSPSPLVSFSLVSSLVCPLLLVSLSRFSPCHLSRLFPVSFMSIAMTSIGVDKHVNSSACSVTKLKQAGLEGATLPLSRSHMNGRTKIPTVPVYDLAASLCFSSFQRPVRACVNSKRPSCVRSICLMSFEHVGVLMAHTGAF